MFYTYGRVYIEYLMVSTGEDLPQVSDSLPLEQLQKPPSDADKSSSSCKRHLA